MMRCGNCGMVLTIITGAAAAGVASADVVTDWNEVWVDAVRATGGAPGPISRAGAIVHAATFDAINSVGHEYEPYHMHLSVPPGTSKEAAGAMAAHTTLTALYDDPALQKLFDAQLAAHLDAIPDGPAKTDGINLGTMCANGMLALRADDGADDPVVYEFGDQPGDWVLTPPDFTPALTPHWPYVTPWTMTSGNQFRPIGPAGFTDMATLLASEEYAAVFEDVRILGEIDSKVRTEEETLIGRFWANDRNGTHKPPGQLNDITRGIAADRGNTLEENARLFALLNLSLADAAIVAWDSKYATPIDLWRPVTAIALADTDGNPATIADPTWVPLSHDPDVNGFTPPFPAWVSGHATFAAAHAGAVAQFYHTDVITFDAESDDVPGVVRTYRSLADAALENGRSRIFLGVHWQFDADDAYVAGTDLAEYIADNFLRPLGDLNGDDLINGLDLGILLANWSIPAGSPGCGGAAHCAPDLNGDGVVDGIDLGTLLSRWTL